MRPPRLRAFAAILAAVLLTVLGTVSAHQMAPDREVLERKLALQSLGVASDALCGIAEDGHTHQCPFCHKLPEPPRFTMPETGARIAWVIVRPRDRDLVFGPQRLRAHAPPRAPPQLV